MFVASARHTAAGIAARRQPVIAEPSIDPQRVERMQLAMQRAEWDRIAADVAKALVDREFAARSRAAREAAREARIRKWFRDAQEKLAAGETDRDRQRAHRILRRVAEQHGLQVKDLTGPRRSKSLMVPRHNAIAEIHRQCPWLSFPQIGRIFNRDHTTIMSAVRKWQAKAALHGIAWMDEMEPGE